MSLLVVQLPARLRLRPEGVSASAPSGEPDELAYVLSGDGLAVQREGRAAPDLLPRADTIVAVLAPQDVSWHRCALPKAPAARLRAALAGLLEESLLEEADTVHLAIADGLRAGEQGWVAACDRAWLQQALARLERGGRVVDRVVPSAWPDSPATVHFETRDGPDGPAGVLRFVLSYPEGVACLPLPGAGMPQVGLWAELANATATASPAAAAPAERWLGRPVQASGAGERLLAATHSAWNLRQFELTPRHRGLAALHNRWRHFTGPAWRPVRLGLAALLLVQLLGLNLQAWSERRALAERREEIRRLFTSTFPKVPVVLDAPVQMQRETDALRAAAGQPGERDLETLMQAAASAWPAGQPVQGLRFEPGVLTLQAAGWKEGQTEAFRRALAPAGWRIEIDGTRLSLRPAEGVR
jgi:general secretion pathway protein L